MSSVQEKFHYMYLKKRGLRTERNEAKLHMEEAKKYQQLESDLVRLEQV